ncbi:MAG: PilZ domain-containing protein [Planctomycetota bacterium]
MDRENEERRIYPRLWADIEVEIAYTDRSGEDRLIAWRAINVSASGILVDADEPLDVGTIFIARFRLPGEDTTVSFLTEVVRIESPVGDRDSFRMGMSFSNVSRDGQKKLDALLTRIYGDN